jgi:hypothetical protein
MLEATEYSEGKADEGSEQDSTNQLAAGLQNLALSATKTQSEQDKASVTCGRTMIPWL